MGPVTKKRVSFNPSASISTQVQIGERLRTLRTAHGISVRNLAAQAGFSASFISQIEKGQASPSIASLERIAAVLDIALGGFFSPQASRATRIVREGERQELTSSWSRAKIEALSPAEGPSKLEVVTVTLSPGGRSGKRHHTNPREQFVIVFEGSITLFLGSETHRLRRGDAVTLNADTAHLWENKSARPVRILVVSPRFPQ